MRLPSARIARGKGILLIHAGLAALGAACGHSGVVDPDRHPVYLDVEAGGFHVCAADDAGGVFCWGHNPGHWLSSSSRPDSTDVEEWLLPRPIDVPPDLSALQAGGNLTCGLAAGEAYCWGGNDRGQLGIGERSGASELHLHPEPAVADVAFGQMGALAASGHACALSTEGAAYCWGNNFRRQVGAGWDTDSLFHSVPTPVAGGHRFAMLAAGTGESCGLTANQDLYCWGADGSGLRDHDRENDRAEPVLISTALRFDTIGVGSSVVCGLVDGTAYCRGWNDNGMLGTGDRVSRTEFTPVAGDHEFRSLSVGRVHACALTEDGTAYCWGAGTFGRLGNGTDEDRTSPTAVGGDLTFRKISAGGEHTCGLTAAGAIYCWGEGFYGQLGNGQRENSALPSRIAPPIDPGD